MEQVIAFLRELYRNNDRTWFAAHKEEYLRVKACVEQFATRLIDGIATFDDAVRGLTVGDCTYRIYRDTRFSPDKRPYKQHIGIFICPGGKKSGRAGYYFHIEPQHRDAESGAVTGGHFLYTGLHCPESRVLHSVREEILFNGDAFEANIAKAEGFTMPRENMLKRMPLGFPADSSYADYLRLREICLERPLSDEELTAPDLLERAVGAFASTGDFCRQLNRAVEYAFEEE